MSLPARMGSNNVERNIEFYAETGALKTLGVQTKGLAVEDAAALGNSVLAMAQAARKEKTTASSGDPTLLMLGRTKEYFNLQYEIQERRRKMR